MTTSYAVNQSVSTTSFGLNELMMLLNTAGAEERSLFTDMISKSKRQYVDAHHKQSISQLRSADPYKNGVWKTHVYINGKRKTIQRKTEDEIYTYLYDFYKSTAEITTLEDVFNMLIQHKETLGRAYQTISEDKRRFAYLDDKLKTQPIDEITEEDLRRWFVRSFLPKRPKQEGLKKMVQLLNAIFNLGRSKKLLRDNPAEFIDYHDYANLCDTSIRTNEERSFSDEDLSSLKAYAMKHKTNPHAVAMLVSMQTGMRAGELASLKVTDISDDFIHVHSQQVRRMTKDGHQQFEYAGYTKNERHNPKGGRYVPITEECKDALTIAEELPGTSEFVFHGKDGSPIQKDSYEQYLRRVCKKLGIEITHNHAFRVAFNARLIADDIDGNDRSLILGHSAQTNERHYSFSDQRRLDRIKQKMTKKEGES